MLNVLYQINTEFQELRRFDQFRTLSFKVELIILGR